MLESGLGIWELGLGNRERRGELGVGSWERGVGLGLETGYRGLGTSWTLELK